MTIVHHAGKGGTQPRIVAQDAYARKQYARKHFSPAYRRLYLTALAARHIIRVVCTRTGAANDSARREGSRRALRALTGHGEPPFCVPPPTALEPRVEPGAEERPSAEESSNPTAVELSGTRV
jgi:hypothetical protein